MDIKILQWSPLNNGTITEIISVTLTPQWSAGSLDRRQVLSSHIRELSTRICSIVNTETQPKSVSGFGLVYIYI